jgi:hypothetical protein
MLYYLNINITEVHLTTFVILKEKTQTSNHAGFVRAVRQEQSIQDTQPQIGKHCAWALHIPI